MVKDFITPEGIWDSRLIRERFEWKDATAILSLETPSLHHDDHKYWKFHPTGKFTIKSGYAFLSGFTQESQHQLGTLSKLIWKLKILPKWRVFLWKLIHKALATKDNLAHRGMVVNNECDYCGATGESTQHIFRTCSLAKLVWKLSSLTIFLDTNGTISFEEWFQRYILLFHSEDGKDSQRIDIFVAVLWSLWLARNARNYKNEEIHARGILFGVSQELHKCNIFKNNRPGVENIDASLNSQHLVQPPGFLHVQLGKEQSFYPNFVLQVDGSWDKNTRKAGAGWAIFNPTTKETTDGGGSYDLAHTPLQLEAHACLKSILWCKNQGLDEILILTDSANLLSNLEFTTKEPHITILRTLAQIKEAASNFKACVIIKADRQQVRRTHIIANNCRRYGISFSSNIV
ncbi:uncharacterized protein [Spinacia oleracea]|uniref:RNase H type-1 domain-containing protein n=1 Tax=Spinacia oleracea TaxID=3562 RepID=A0ABM3RH05_SPIOL|nr:uncharacterized protein LOC130469565 [Spinacia oleracea]